MFAAAPLSYWIGFHALVGVLLLIDLVVLQRRNIAPSQAMAWGWTGFVAVLAGCFAIFIGHSMGRQPALEFTSGYLIEGSLSVDNLFVFLLMFRALGLSREEQRRALLWGVLGAIVMRALFISLGVSLITRFEWIQYVFGVILLGAAVRLLRPTHAKQKPSKMLEWLRGRHSRAVATAPMKNSTSPASTVAGTVAATPAIPLAVSSLLFVILAIEVTDLIFALDSIPAVLAITHNAFIVYTSNIFAILGLRSLFFALSHLLDKLRLLHYGLAVILGFVALKMLLAKWVNVPVTWSLVVILTILGVFTLASIFSTKPAPGTRHQA
ncbi:MAG TPA: TerC/Alx family metal homeostasis membrane protein [Acidisarcina sp.]